CKRVSRTRGVLVRLYARSDEWVVQNEKCDAQSAEHGSTFHMDTLLFFSPLGDGRQAKLAVAVALRNLVVIRVRRPPGLTGRILRERYQPPTTRNDGPCAFIRVPQ